MECIIYFKSFEKSILLRNYSLQEKYIPDYLEQKAKINYGEVEKVVVEGRHEPLISKEYFQKVQQIMDSHSRPIKLGRKQASSIGLS